MFQERISRRALLKSYAHGIAGLGAIAIVGCGDDETSLPTAAPSSASAIGIPTRQFTPTPAAKLWTWTPVHTIGGPKPRRDHSLTFNPDDDRMYLFGGRTAGVADNELWMYDPKSASWLETPASGTGPPPRFAHNAVYDAAGKRLIVALGQGNGTAFFNDVWAYDGEVWTQLDAPSAEGPAIRYGSGGALDPEGNRLLITHGFTDVGRFDDT